MDSRIFDELTRSAVTDPTSRRGTLKLLLAAAFAASISWLNPTEAAARCRKPGEKCQRRGKRRATCCSGSRCVRRRCRCAGNRNRCGPRCADLQTDPRNCGTCGKTCATGEICRIGLCVAGQGSCPAGADHCLGEDIPCNGISGCFCVQSMEGDTRCGMGGGGESVCGQCRSSAECERFGAGAFCIKDTGPNCGCPLGAGFCAVPCQQF
jgi:hypothetical protein